MCKVGTAEDLPVFKMLKKNSKVLELKRHFRSQGEKILILTFSGKITEKEIFF